MTIGKNLRITLAGTAAALAIAAPVAQACTRSTSSSPAPAPVDVCQLDVNALLAKYGGSLTDAQKQWVIQTAQSLLAAKCGGQVTVGPSGGGSANY